MQVNVGDLVRYKHDKWQVGLVVELRPERGDDTIYVKWLKPKPEDGKDAWCVQPMHIEVKGKGRYGWTEADC